MAGDQNDIPALMARLQRAEGAYSDVTRRIDLQSEKTSSLERAVAATDRNVDKLSSALEAQKELRVERDARVVERINAIEEAMDKSVANVTANVNDFISETRKAFNDQRAFSRQIAFIAIGAALSTTGAFIIFLLTRGFNATTGG